MSISAITKTSGSILFSVAFFMNVCAQSSSVKYFGSTPCDSLIKKNTGIPSGSACDFIKWNVEVEGIDNDSGTVQLSYNYGESQNNTNGFKQGGTTRQLNGKYYLVKTGTSGRKRFHVMSTDNIVELWLMEMDKNIYLFTDAEGKLLLGNAGYSYILNRVRN